MIKSVVFCYRKVIDSNAVLPWEKMVFEDSYLEFKMQFQYYNQQRLYYTFAELSQQDTNADNLHFLISPTISGYLKQLNGKIPDILNTIGKRFMKFEKYQFELINSDIRNISNHQIAINFYSEPLLWLDTIDDYLLLSDVIPQEETVLTNLFRLQPFVNIHSLTINNG